MTFAPGTLFDVLRRLSHPRDIAHVHGGTALVGDHRAQVIVRVLDLVVGIDGVIEFRTVEIAFRLAHVDVREGGANVADAEAVSGKFLRVAPARNGRTVAPGGRDLTHPR